ncbi:hypothetical protein SSPO_068530 [Streptomyces antimycoticus]|uniref:Uncharacterized protein n=1 Tax=Streptomyces antimycoticus TaxID=68175 RepID=A0A499UPW3_9ACTN|nr:hypothetical protein [Streptomyces antimycoticus]BBJ44135.1 hypothetical protein SSPO_068530 [Streptomyces antimycoticus]
MTAVTPAALPGVPLPDADTLTGPQLRGRHCTLCERRLFADQRLGTVEWTCDGTTEVVELWVCRPLCTEAAGAQGRPVRLPYRPAGPAAQRDPRATGATGARGLPLHRGRSGP